MNFGGGSSGKIHIDTLTSFQSIFLIVKNKCLPTQTIIMGHKTNYNIFQMI